MYEDIIVKVCDMLLSLPDISFFMCNSASPPIVLDVYFINAYETSVIELVHMKFRQDFERLFGNNQYSREI